MAVNKVPTSSVLRLVTIMWANEPFDPEKPDTYFLEV
jgi:UDP-2-acetamido-2,6-beta-L-arabino-hexul-4-ose reductase